MLREFTYKDIRQPDSEGQRTRKGFTVGPETDVGTLLNRIVSKCDPALGQAHHTNSVCVICLQ